MKYFKLDLLTLLVSLFIFSGCEKDGTIGLDIAPQDSIKSRFTDTATVNTTTVREDTVMTTNIAQNPFGLIKDPIFGNTEANLALGLLLPSENFSFGTSPTLDSAVLVLKYGDEFSGDSVTSNYAVKVQQLNTPFNTSKTYYSNSVFSPSATIIGSLNNFRKFRWQDSILVNSIVKNGPDKVVTAVPQLRIRLNSDFVRTNLLQAEPTKLKTNFAFSNHFKGLYVSINQSLLTGNGGLTFFNLQSNVSAVEIYYKTTNGSTVDTIVSSFKVVGASEIKRDNSYAGTPIQQQLQNPNTSYSTVYVQPLGGLKTRINFPHIKRLASQGKISINKAELVITAVNAANDPLVPAPRLAFYTSDIAGQRQYVPDNGFFDQRTFGGFYNATNKTYTFNITNFIQDLITKPAAQYHSFIAPVDATVSSTPSIAPSAVTAARSILGGKGHPQSPIKLKITYTRPN